MNVSPLAVVAGTALLTFAVLAVAARFYQFSLFTHGLPVAVLAGVVAAAASGTVSVWRGAAWVGVVVFFGSGVAVLSRGEGREFWRAVRSRLLFGVPWGTLVVVATIVAFYLFVQFGVRGTGSPLVVPFVSWSYFYPLGVVTAPFAHASLGHVTGNLVATLVLAPIVEYAISHFPTERGASSFGSWRTNPYVRAFVLVPLGIAFVSLLTGLFSWGATIGFSGVVFAFAGFALVRYPLATVVAVVAQDVLALLWSVLRDPITFASVSPSFSPPWWAGISVQGHLFGFLVGAVLAALLLARRDERPSAARVWFGSVVIATSLSLWAVWWYGRSVDYVLYRSLGVLLVVALALVLTAAVRADETTIARDLTGRKAAVVLLLLPVVTMSMVAVPINLTTVEDAELAGDPVEIRGYEVTYAEDVQNERVAAVQLPLFAQATNVSASGVIVASDSRTIWTERVSAGELAFFGDSAVTVGGVGWEETVWAHRRGWVPRGGNPVYNVYLQPPGSDWRPVFASNSSTADPVVTGRQVRIDAMDGRFAVEVVRNDSVLGTARIPAVNESTTAGGLTFVRQEQKLLAERGNTTVTVATRETYE
ncbi:rhomboid family intramembrane serine protease [Halobacterium wangiae]|uniref:rhomboid family intramembrane serine protease n=1 Tax=Halobacterium wangiae TaxID=2902623 RepID=UPI001E3CC7BB|nr:rhomboid family intramembrane serine protease [Halobacterium wangiae]